MIRALYRSITNLEELNRIEREEAAEEERRRAIEAIPSSSDPPIPSDDFINS
jgi:hypothetical protein